MNLRLSLWLIPTIFISLRAVAAEPLNSNWWGPVTNSVRMSISLKGGDRVIRTNEQFQLLVRLRNLSETNVWTYKALATTTGLFEGVHCQVTSPSGKDISPPDVFWRGGSGYGINVPPHDMAEFTFDLSYICRFDEAGIYTVVASKGIGLGKNKAWIVVSNPLLISVVATNIVTKTNRVSPP
jgi:hypothetical protein